MVLRLGGMRFLHELHLLLKITDGRKLSGRYPAVCFPWCRSYIYMLTGNNFTYHFRALRLLVETVIQNTVQEANDDDDVISRLQYHAICSTTANVWAVGLIKPIFLITIFLHCLALPCLTLPCRGPLAPRGAVGVRRDGLPHQLSPVLPVVCHGLNLCEGFPGPLRDVVNPAIFRTATSSHAFDCSL